MHQAYRNVEPAALPPGVGADEPVGEGFQVDLTDERCRLTLGGGLAHAMELALQDEVLAPGLYRLGAALLADVADLPAHPVRFTPQVVAADLRLPASRLKEGRQHTHG